jgi:MerR family transcriptional regulator/heat shock protein HspR
MSPQDDPLESELGASLPSNAAFVISVAARLVGVHEQTLRYYERAGLVEPARSKGRIRLYSLHDLERLRQIRRLTDHIHTLEERIEQLEAELRRPRADSPRHPARS